MGGIPSGSIRPRPCLRAGEPHFRGRIVHAIVNSRSVDYFFANAARLFSKNRNRLPNFTTVPILRPVSDRPETAKSIPPPSPRLAKGTGWAEKNDQFPNESLDRRRADGYNPSIESEGEVNASTLAKLATGFRRSTPLAAASGHRFPPAPCLRHSGSSFTDAWKSWPQIVRVDRVSVRNVWTWLRANTRFADVPDSGDRL